MVPRENTSTSIRCVSVPPETMRNFREAIFRCNTRAFFDLLDVAAKFFRCASLKHCLCSNNVNQWPSLHFREHGSIQICKNLSFQNHSASQPAQCLVLCWSRIPHAARQRGCHQQRSNQRCGHIINRWSVSLATFEIGQNRSPWIGAGTDDDQFRLRFAPVNQVRK